MTDLTLNPSAEIILRRDAGAIAGITVCAPMRGVPMRTTTIDESEGAVFGVLKQVAEGRALELDLDDTTWDRLASIGLLVPSDKVSAPCTFRCPLPAPATGFDRAALRVHPGLRCTEQLGAPASAWVKAASAGRIRGAVRGRAVVNAFAADQAWATVEDAAYPAPLLLSLSPVDAAVVARLVPGAPVPADLDVELCARLVAAGVLVEDHTARIAAWTRTRAAAVDTFARDRYALVRELVQPAWIDALRVHYAALIAEGYAGFDTTLGRNRYCMHNEPVSRVVHEALAPLASEIAGQALKPSYAYFGAYREGAKLVPHRDRDQCPISISLLVDYEGPIPWPLCLRVPRTNEVVEGVLAPGDGMFFDGTQLEHWRAPLPAGHRSTSLFLHFVPTDFTKELD